MAIVFWWRLPAGQPMTEGTSLAGWPAARRTSALSPVARGEARLRRDGGAEQC